MPVLFVGHGNPMNAIEDNDFSREWQRLGEELPRPSAVLSISAHWYTKRTLVTAMETPRTIHDFFGFPEELFEVRYPAPGSRNLAARVEDLASELRVFADTEWGLDHGTWSALSRMYPRADVPVIQVSLNGTAPASFHYRLGRALKPLREEGVLIMGSGNIVHNLFEVEWKEDLAYDWALQFDETVKKLILAGDHESLINYQSLGEPARLSIPTDEHYLPMLCVLGASDEGEKPRFFNEKVTLGSVGMRSFTTETD